MFETIFDDKCTVVSQHVTDGERLFFSPFQRKLIVSGVDVLLRTFSFDRISKELISVGDTKCVAHSIHDIHGFTAILVYHDKPSPASHFALIEIGHDKSMDKLEWLTSSEKIRNGDFSKSLQAYRCDYLLIGNGFISREIQRIFTMLNIDFKITQPRIHNKDIVSAMIDLFSPSYIILTSGIAGTPNSGWCDDNPFETTQSNILGQISVAEAARQRSVPLATIGSACVFQYQTEARSDCAHDDSSPNIECLPGESFYIQTRCALERLNQFFPEVLQLRVTYPVTRSLHPKSLLGKLVTFSSVHDTPMSVSILDDIIPMIPQLLNNGVRGHINFCNPGTVSLVDLRQRLDATKLHLIKGANIAPFEICRHTFSRAAYHAIPDTLMAMNPNLPSAQERVCEIIENMTITDFL